MYADPRILCFLEKGTPLTATPWPRLGDQCRASREKCDGTQPTCHTCTSQRRGCTYHEQPKKRGIQPNYIRTLELIIAWLLRASPNGENKLAAHLCAVEDPIHRTISAKDSNGAETLHQRWRNSIICRQIDQMLSGASIEMPTIQPSAQTYGSPPLSAPSDKVQAPTDCTSGVDTASSNELYPDANGRGRKPDPVAVPNCHEKLYVQNASAVPQLLQQDSGFKQNIATRRLKLPENTWTLLEYYFAFTHAWIPIVEKQSLLKAVYTYPVDGVPYEGLAADTSSYGELCTILALSATQLQQNGHFHNTAITKELREAAYSLVSFADPRMTPSYVRIVLLHVVMQIVAQDWIKGWLLMGQAVRVLLHLETSNGQNETQSAVFRPLRLAAFVIEATVARQLGIAFVHLRPEYIERVGFMNEDGSEEWLPWQDPLIATSLKAPAMAYSTLNRLVRLTLQSFNAQGSLHAQLLGPGGTTSKSLGAPSPTGAGFGMFAGGLGESSQHPSSAVSGFGASSYTANPTIPTPVHLAVTALVQNALKPRDRLQPMTLVARCENGPVPSAPVSGSTANPFQGQQHLAFMSIPNETPESVLSGSPGLLRSATEDTNVWPNEAHGMSMVASSMIPAPSEHTASGADIFEELALLDKVDSSDNPQFMQNLGFAPDIDLAEFFGADYQPSDPLLAYMQPSFFNTHTASGQLSTEPG
jgi:hypothetical protein